MDTTDIKKSTTEQNNAGGGDRSKVVAKINESNNILVTVSRDPSVDELSAAIGLTTVLDAMGKHVTTIFSGDVPPAISFLNPENIFENNVNSLRDFIIALNKEKADHLRYKVDGDLVKIFITPYKAVITSDDLEFSQGDYNVELVFAIGVENKADLDAALSAHGGILHDAAVVGLSIGDQTSSLSSIDWHEQSVSSYSEAVTELTELLSGDQPLVDQAAATALLTGIVAATDRFSNLKTSARVMTLAAQLMAAGADQQLIASRLQESKEIGQSAAKATVPDIPEASSEQGATEDGVLSISRDTTSVSTDPVPAPEQSTAPIDEGIQDTAPPMPTPEIPQPTEIASAYALDSEDLVQDTSPPPTPDVIVPAATPASSDRSYVSADVGDSNTAPTSSSVSPSAVEATSEPSPMVTRLDTKSIQPVSPDLVALSTQQEDQARQAIDQVLATSPVTPQPPVVPPMPTGGLPMPPPLPDFGSIPPQLPPQPIVGAPQSEAILGDILAPDPVAAPPLPQGQPQVAAPGVGDPSQYRIPGQ